jgi:hypothetical protein
MPILARPGSLEGAPPLTGWHENARLPRHTGRKWDRATHPSVIPAVPYATSAPRTARRASTWPWPHRRLLSTDAFG